MGKCFKFFKIFQKSLIGTFVLNILPNRNFGDGITVQDLRGINVWNFSDVLPSNQNPGAAPVYSTYCIFSSCHLCPFKFYTWRTPCYATFFYLMRVIKLNLIYSTYWNSKLHWMSHIYRWIYDNATYCSTFNTVNDIQYESLHYNTRELYNQIFCTINDKHLVECLTIKSTS